MQDSLNTQRGLEAQESCAEVFSKSALRDAWQQMLRISAFSNDFSLGFMWKEKGFLAKQHYSVAGLASLVVALRTNQITLQRLELTGKFCFLPNKR